MLQNKHTTWACFLVILIGIVMFGAGTDGFRAYTAESARVLRLNKEQPVFPAVTLEDSTGRIYPFSELAGKYVFITFIYASCSTVCPQLVMNMADIYDRIPGEYRGEDIIFLSISFDPARDDVATLREYQHHFHKDEATWRMARVPDQAQLDTLLRTFGVIVIPDNKGDFMHNSAFYLVDRQGRLAEVMDYTKIDQNADKIKLNIEKDKGEIKL